MAISENAYRFTQSVPLTVTEGGVTGLIGTYNLDIDVRGFTDVRNLQATRAYIVTCRQRLIVPNQSAFTPGSNGVTLSTSYPAVLSATLTPESPPVSATVPGNLAIRLLDYQPRTLNTAVISSQNQNNTQGTSSSQQFSSGSSVSQTNSFSVSVNAGFFGDAPTGGASVDESMSETDSSFDSQSAGQGSSQDRQMGAATSMSIKDWGAYAQLDTATQTAPTWLWGQEYPWDVIQNGDGVPASIQGRMVDGSNLVPPSHLALFGIDMTSVVSWQVAVLGQSATGDSLTITPSGAYWTASNTISTSTAGGVTTSVAAGSLDAQGAFAVAATNIDLSIYALNPISGPGADNGAVIGFLASKFLVPITTAGGAFRICSTKNNLEIRGTGFNGTMTTDFSAGPVSMTVFFKISDADEEYTLYLKSWKTQTTNVKLTLTFADDPASSIVRYIDATEAAGGESNLTTIVLRNKDFAALNYCDYLSQGLNILTIVFEPGDNSSLPCGYEIRALAIG